MTTCFYLARLCYSGSSRIYVGWRGACLNDREENSHALGSNVGVAPRSPSRDLLAFMQFPFEHESVSVFRDASGHQRDGGLKFRAAPFFDVVKASEQPSLQAFAGRVESMLEFRAFPHD